ncbi:MAG: hypothetical protein ACYDEE_16240 [Ignavibacteriaceae bacterium]
MGRMLLILVLGGGMLFSVANLNINTSNVAMATNAYVAYQNAQAKDYARSGIEIAIKNLTIDTTYTGTTSKQLTGGTVTITVQNTNSQYYNGPNANLVSARLITSVGTVGNRSDTIRSIIQLPISGSGNNPPGFLNYALASGGDLGLSGNVVVRDDNNSSWNANVQTNQDFEMEGNSKIKGFLTYGGEAEGKLSSNITPNQNPNNLPAYSKVAPIGIPAFNPDDFKSKATIVYSGDKSMSGNTLLGTKDNPQIIYVGGDLTLSGNITGYGVFIVKGDIKINGNVNITTVDPSGSNLGLYTGGELKVKGNVVVHAQIFANEVSLGGNSSIYGSITSQEEIKMEGDVNVFYRPATSALTNPFWPQNNNGSTAARPSIISYYE